MIVDRYRSSGKALTRYVRKSYGKDDLYQWCEQSAKDTRYDVAQGFCNGSDLPPEIKKKCDDYYGAFYACEWPL